MRVHFSYHNQRIPSLLALHLARMAPWFVCIAVMVMATTAPSQVRLRNIRSTLDFIGNNGAGGAVGGRTVVVVKFPQGGSHTVILNIGAGASPESVATAVAQSINANFPGTATVVGSQISLRNGSFTTVPANAIGAEKNFEGDFGLNDPEPGINLARLSFEPNFENGQATLVGDFEITAGFAEGLSPVSFTAPDGATLDELAALVEAELEAGGYEVLPVSPTAMDIFSTGAGVSGLENTLRFNFRMEPLSEIEDRGIAIGLTPTVPDSGTAASLLAFALTVLAGYRRRTRLE